MTAEKILVNGSLIDRDYFEDNLTEAMSCQWESVIADTIVEHNHCIICMMPISSDQNETVYRSGNRFLCSHCFERFIMES